MKPSTAEVRQMFLNFFQNKGHQVVSSSSLIPKNDSTILFTNAGMNQFKDIFLGKEKQIYSRVTSSQRCIRAGGKHNDLTKVGFTTRHHTFFEMLGNFSFGDYFKHEAIAFAWELLTSRHWFNLPKEKLWVTVYQTDNETFDIWKKEIGVQPTQIIRIGDHQGKPYSSDNFWTMGKTGPCGPSSEIFFDHGPNLFGSPPGTLNEDGDRYVEIWNIVFMQFNRQLNGTMIPLPYPSVDTGMGLERITAVLQNVHSNYKIDVFTKLIQSAAEIIGTKDLNNKSLHVIADHIRSCAFLISDGVIPSNDNQSYVLRRLIRRAVHHGKMLGAKETFFFKLVDPLISIMDINDNNFNQKKKKIEKVLRTEEEQCTKNIERGVSLLNTELALLSDNTLRGDIVFRLYDTFGFPLEWTENICKQRNVKIDKIGFEYSMKQQRQRARNASNFHSKNKSVIYITQSSVFKGYEYLQLQTVITSINVDGESVKTISHGKHGIIVLETTPCYAESGGQIGDSGNLYDTNNSHFIIHDTQRYAQAIGHTGQIITGELHIGDTVIVKVNKQRRERICLNHSGTHLLQAALRQVLGQHVEQKGSYINDCFLRFDFSHYQAMTLEEIYEVEEIINSNIRLNALIETHVMKLETAKESGAIALFNETYSDYVRVLKINDCSIELCGGTHAKRTGDIGLFHLLSESSIAAGVRRIEAVTGDKALSILQKENKQLLNIAHLFKANRHNIYEKIHTFIQYTHNLEEKINKIENQKAIQESSLLVKNFIIIKDIKILVHALNNIEPKTLHIIIKKLKNHIGSGIIVLASILDGKVSIITNVTSNLTDYIKACDIITILAPKIDGKGGGNAHIAQAGGLNASALPEALIYIKEWLSENLKNIT
ncbi:alanine--tRNA ligase [Candidatus Erwinia haradaeae]|uniref:Alanine--tRNA ligase n=1 Tax=Candidatus Erwinia haradaeae TaxID=1922217 RepID=A0A803GD46_9GAMM|nr:alanine--tRNA ligase [Candidatus Erwinia haradaeae]VFP88713.1 Alanine--tRNA ligase [Candidatus Erwinia haradaeae]